jgi:hypothetical protein
MATTPAQPSVEQQKNGLFATPNYSQYNLNPADSVSPNPVNTAAQTNAAGNQVTGSSIITPKPNVLDNFASTTWAASVYLLSPDQYKELVVSQKKRVNGYNLLFQSGGAPNNTTGFQGALATGQQTRTQAGGTNESVAPGVPGAAALDAGRNPAFDLDFYIDSVIIDNAILGKIPQAAHMVTSIKFTVVEPNNISLIDRIYAAVQDMAQSSGFAGPINYTAAQYLLVMRWYGYDIDGNLVAGKTSPGPDGISDTNAIVEKFIPFLISKIDWHVSSKTVTYDFECAPVGHMIDNGTNRGTVPYDVELSAGTVGQLLKGIDGGPDDTAAPTNGVQVSQGSISSGRANDAAQRAANAELARESRQSVSTISASPKNAGTAPNITLKRGLAKAMNDYSEQLMLSKIYEFKDTYEIIFAAGAEEIENATLVLPGSRITQIAQKMTPMGVAPSANPNQALNADANAMNITARKWSITAGMSIVQAIDLAIRNSSYIYNQGLVSFTESGEQIANRTRVGKTVKWFNIIMTAYPTAYDSKRNDYAYNITFTIAPYTLQNFESEYFPVPEFRGVHKSYPYWFTGINTAVLDYTANFNSLYNLTVSGGSTAASGLQELRRNQTSNMKELIKYYYAPNSTESNKGAELKGNEVGANAAEYLYAIGGPGSGNIKIIGDPAWIQQGSLAGGIFPQEFNYDPFLPDGTINFDSEQVLFEISWQRPEDYNLATGLADPYARTGGKERQPIQSNVYQAVKVISEFRGGKFEQQIEGTLYVRPTPDGKNTVNGVNSSNAGAGQSSSAFAEKDPRRFDDKLNAAGSSSAITTDRLRAISRAAGRAAGRISPAITATSVAGNFLDSAKTAQAGTASSGALVPNSLNPLLNASGSSVFSSPPPLPADTVTNASYPKPPTGSGVSPAAVPAAPPRINAGTTTTPLTTQIITTEP